MGRWLDEQRGEENGCLTIGCMFALVPLGWAWGSLEWLRRALRGRLLNDAWAELHDATPDGWSVGSPSYDERRGVWEQYAHAPAEPTQAYGEGVRSPELMAVAPTELEVIREMARCLRLIREGRVPE